MLHCNPRLKAGRESWPIGIFFLKDGAIRSVPEWWRSIRGCCTRLFVGRRRSRVWRSAMTVFREQLLPWPGHVHQHPNPVGRRNSRRTPSVLELLASPVVQQALNSAWLNSRVNDVRLYHEEG